MTAVVLGHAEYAIFDMDGLLSMSMFSKSIDTALTGSVRRDF